MGLDRNALDRYITGGRYSSCPMLVTCSKCQRTTPVVAETEYGGTTWSPEECSHCSAEFTGDEQWEEADDDTNHAYDDDHSA